LTLQIFAHGQRIDVTDAPLIEVAGTGVMRVVAAPPSVVGRQGQRADRPPNPVIGSPRSEKSTMTAIMLNNEEADEQARCGKRQEQCKSVAERKHRPHQEPDQTEGSYCNSEFEGAARGARLAIAIEKGSPVARAPRNTGR
jgi:hypothetical protein